VLKRPNRKKQIAKRFALFDRQRRDRLSCSKGFDVASSWRGFRESSLLPWSTLLRVIDEVEVLTYQFLMSDRTLTPPA